MVWPYETGGSFWPTIVNILLFSIGSFQFATAGQVLTQGSYLQFAMLIPLVAMTYAKKRTFDRHYLKRFQYPSLSNRFSGIDKKPEIPEESIANVDKSTSSVYPNWTSIGRSSSLILRGRRRSSSRTSSRRQSVGGNGEEFMYPYLHPDLTDEMEEPMLPNFVVEIMKNLQLWGTANA